MKVVIWGAGKAGRFLLDDINAHGECIDVEAILDSNLNGTKISDSIVCHPIEYLSTHKIENIILAAGAQKSIWKMIMACQKYNVENVYMLHDIAGKNKLPLFLEGKLSDRRIRHIRFSDEKPTLPYFEIPIVDTCNMNCRGCLFTCNVNIEHDYMKVDEIEKDFLRMKELFEDIPWIRILGGEPLLHPDLTQILEMGRTIFPDSEIDVCTNGLLLLKLRDEQLRVLKEKNITVHISGYKPTFMVLDEIEAILKKWNIDYCVLKRDKFYKFYTNTESNDPAKSHEACPSSGCRELYRGKLAKCSAVMAFERMNTQFDMDYKITAHKDYFNIHDREITGWEILSHLDKEVPLCRYCDTEHIEYFDWENGKSPVLEDYLI